MSEKSADLIFRDFLMSEKWLGLIFRDFLMSEKWLGLIFQRMKNPRWYFREFLPQQQQCGSLIIAI